MSDLGVEAQLLKDRLSELIDEDTDAFNAIIKSNKLPSGTDEDRKIKKLAINNAYQLAIETPYEIATLCAKVLDLCVLLSQKGNPNSISDIGVASESALAGFKGASMNVIINLPSINDKKIQKEMKEKLENMSKTVESSYELTNSEVYKVMNS